MVWTWNWGDLVVPWDCKTFSSQPFFFHQQEYDRMRVCSLCILADFYFFGLLSPLDPCIVTLHIQLLTCCFAKLAFCPCCVCLWKVFITAVFGQTIVAACILPTDPDLPLSICIQILLNFVVNLLNFLKIGKNSVLGDLIKNSWISLI